MTNVHGFEYIMRISNKNQSKLYKAIHDPIVDLRIKLRLSSDKDVLLAQVEHEIWRRQKEVWDNQSDLSILR
jgi:hypothetical protein